MMCVLVARCLKKFVKSDRSEPTQLLAPMSPFRGPLADVDPTPEQKIRATVKVIGGPL